MNGTCSEEVKYNLNGTVQKLTKEVMGLCGAIGIDSQHSVPEKSAPPCTWQEELSLLIQSINASANDIDSIGRMVVELHELICGPATKNY